MPISDVKMGDFPLNPHLSPKIPIKGRMGRELRHFLWLDTVYCPKILALLFSGIECPASNIENRLGSPFTAAYIPTSLFLAFASICCIAICLVVEENRSAIEEIDFGWNIGWLM